MNDYSTRNRARNAAIVANRAELSVRREEAWAARALDHVNLQPPREFQDPVTGRRELASDPRLVALGRYLRRARRYSSKSQQRVASETGVTQSMVSRAERGLAPAMGIGRLVRLCEALGRLFPLGACPHDHECAWQPIRPPERQTTAVERLVALLQNPWDESEPDPAERSAGDPSRDRPDEPLISVTLDDLSVGSLHGPRDGEQVRSDGRQVRSDGGQDRSDGRQVRSDGGQVRSDGPDEPLISVTLDDLSVGSLHGPPDRKEMR